MDVLLVVAGLIALVAGGELIVKGAVGGARALGISPLVIGLTIVGFGTSMPEMVTSLQAALSGAPGIAIGNVVGSNIANILLILGIGALLAPIAVGAPALIRDGGVLTLASLALLGAALGGTVGPVTGGVFLAGLGAYLAFTLRAERRAAGDGIYAEEAAMVEPVRGGIGRVAGAFALGLAITIFGARTLVDGAVSLAAAAGVSEAVIGLTVVAVGTSLPELFTTIVAARRGAADVAFGNVIGSNIFNILGILGVTAMVTPVAVPEAIAGRDIWVMLGTTILLLVVARTGWRVGRREGTFLLGLYALYLGVLALGLG